MLDLRNNPGGLLTQAVKVSDLFLDGGLIVYTDGRLENQKQKYFAHKPGTLRPTSRWSCWSTAAAPAPRRSSPARCRTTSARWSSARRPSARARCRRSCRSTSNSALRLTTARYYTPNGRSIQATGIVPDIIMDQGTQAREGRQADVVGRAAARGEPAAPPRAPERREDAGRPSDDDERRGDVDVPPEGVQGRRARLRSAARPGARAAEELAGLQDLRRQARRRRASRWVRRASVAARRASSRSRSSRPASRARSRPSSARSGWRASSRAASARARAPLVRAEGRRGAARRR